MKKVIGMVCGLALVLGSVSGDEPKPKSRGQLPPNWKKLDLTQTQKGKIYDIQSKYRKQIADLKMQINALQLKQMKDMVAVLTKAQKAKLAEGLTEDTKDGKSEKKSGKE